MQEDSGRWYPDPSLEGARTGQQINNNPAPYNVLNLDPFVWFVHKQLGLSGYGFSLTTTWRTWAANGATKLAINVGGLKGLPQQAEWAWGAPYGPVNSTRGTFGTVQGGDFNGKQKITQLDETPLPVGLLVHGGDVGRGTWGVRLRPGHFAGDQGLCYSSPPRTGSSSTSP